MDQASSQARTPSRGILSRALDRVAEASVVLSYGATGYALRAPSWDPAELDVDLQEKIVVVTGANSGLGYATAHALAARGASVIMICRSRARGDEARSRIARETGNERVELVIGDLSVMADVRAVAAELRGRLTRIDRLILNAGVMLAERETTPEGLEKTFATNVVGGFLLQSELMPLLLEAGDSRVLHVTSGGMYSQRIDLDRLQGTDNDDGWDGVRAYAQTKRAQVILNELWAERLADTGVVSHAMHPGWADTPGVRNSLPRFHRLLKPLLRDAQQGADTLLWLAVADAPQDSSGRLWLDREPRRTHVFSRTRETDEDRARLWALVSDAAASAGAS